MKTMRGPCRWFVVSLWAFLFVMLVGCSLPRHSSQREGRPDASELSGERSGSEPANLREWLLDTSSSSEMAEELLSEFVEERAHSDVQDASPPERPSDGGVGSEGTIDSILTKETKGDLSPDRYREFIAEGAGDKGRPEKVIAEKNGRPEKGTPDKVSPDKPAGISCRDGKRNGNETDVDCGGSCSPCVTNRHCRGNADCAASRCWKDRCCAPSCKNKACGTSDGCGQLCTPSFGCCVPSCKGKTCGAPNGCRSFCKAGSGCHLLYPTRAVARLKGLQPDHWGKRSDIINANTGGIAVNFVWATWEPVVKSPPCASNEQEYDNHCYRISKNVDDEVRAYSSKGVVVTGVLYGVPAWARKTRTCSPASPGFAIFCAPDKASDYARFVGMIAHRYNGNTSKGRVADFVIHNEVNSNTWFDIGCGRGKPCDQASWIRIYADNYIAAYDAVMKEQRHAKVLISLEHHFGTKYDQPSAPNALISGMSMILGVAAKAGARKWRVAFHSYPPSLLAPVFSPNDFPKVTFGNLGVLVGWLRQTFPSKPSSWEIQLTENGVNSLAPSSPQAQKTSLCNAFHNIVGTPGIESFIYHRMTDHPHETVMGLGLGLRNSDGSAKPAWGLWASVNRTDLKPPKLSCGFQALPYIHLTRSFHRKHGHWASTRLPPSGFKAERSWRILRSSKPNTKMLYSCRVGKHNLLSTALSCEKLFMLGPVGYVYKTKQSGTVPLYRCHVQGGDHFISGDPKCEGQVVESLLGYVLP